MHEEERQASVPVAARRGRKTDHPGRNVIDLIYGREEANPLESPDYQLLGIKAVGAKSSMLCREIAMSDSLDGNF